MKRVLKSSSSLKQLKVRRLESVEAPTAVEIDPAACTDVCEGPGNQSIKNFLLAGDVAQPFAVHNISGDASGGTAAVDCTDDWEGGEGEGGQPPAPDFGLLPDAADFMAAGGGMGANACVAAYIPAGNYC